jgi:hypothetical protein
MKIPIRFVSGAAIVAGLVGAAAGADCTASACALDHAASPAQNGADPQEAARREIAERLLPLMPAAHRDAIIAARGLGSENMPEPTPAHQHDPEVCEHPATGITPREHLAKVITPELGERMTEIQWQIANGIVETLERGQRPPALCFAPDTDPDYAFAINQLIEFPLTVQFQQTSRWTRTALSGTGLGQGDPTIITYSFVPDGTPIPSIIGVSGNSNLRAWLNGIYGSQATWQPLFEQVFDRWSELIGTSYVFESNDDGAQLNNSTGFEGVRGDVRIAALTIDGNSGTLAYNNFPNDGDMVFDSADSFYNNTGGNSLRFRNVIAHEHGHGLGMLHVCPANQTKLMEPFVSTAYNGPQLDDILNGQRHYGDNFEPESDSPFTAESIGSVSVGGIIGLSNVSLDSSSDIDYYRITLNTAAQIEINVSPDAGAYQQGPQTQACNTGSTTNYNAIQNLALTIYSAASPLSPLAAINNAGIGETEILIFDAVESGDYIIRVTGDSTNNIQRYALNLIARPLPFLVPTVSANPPASVDPGVPTAFIVTIDPREDVLVGVPNLFFRNNGGAFAQIPLAPVSGNQFTATLPAADCGEAPQFYISAVGQTGGEITLPAAGAAEPFNAFVGEEIISIDDNFESDTGWTVAGNVNNAAAGRWERAIPGGDGSRGDPINDFDGSGRAFVTGNGGPGSNTDVDGGETILISPAFDAAGLDAPVLSYARWYDNTGSGSGAAPGADVFKVQISSDNGVSWQILENVGPNTAQSAGGWFQVSFDLASIATLTSQMRVRFIADDLGSGSVIEAAVDAFKVSGRTCEDPGNPGCSPADLATPFGVINFFDAVAYLGLFNAGDPASDFAPPLGTVNFFDVLEFLNQFNAGCP